MIHGYLQSVDEAAVLEGANIAVIGDGDPDHWEVLQFAKAELVAPKTYELSVRLRGQNGTEALAQRAWVAGSWFVVLDAGKTQLDLPSASIGLERTYRVGPASRPVSDPIFVGESHAFKGNGLRPFAPAHLRGKTQDNGDIQLSWIRRTRVGGDSWSVPEIPLGEDVELYRLDVYSDGEWVHGEDLTQSDWTYPVALQSSHGLTGIVEVRVAQVSALYGVGQHAALEFSVA
jgi:hypothetical protein